MSRTWHHPDGDRALPVLGWRGWLRAGPRLALVAATLVPAVAMFALARLIERAFLRGRRGISAWIHRVWARLAVAVLGMNLRITGRPMRHPGAFVANHVGWSDILVLSAACPGHFVSKADVSAWPGIGALARMTGTLFIRRERREAGRQIEQMRGMLKTGSQLIFFPEGTSSDGLRVLPFNPTLFAVFRPAEGEAAWVQPVALIYHAPDGRDPRFYGWFGEMPFGAHFLDVAAGQRGVVEVRFLEPVNGAAFITRRDLALHCETVVRGALPAHIRDHSIKS